MTASPLPEGEQPPGAPRPSEAEEAAIRELRALRPLPPENDPGWDTPDEGYWRDAELLKSLADRSGREGWRALAIAVFELAADWDVYGVMQGIRHGPEQAWIGDSEGMAAALVPLLSSDRPGTVLWVARELGILRVPASMPALFEVCSHHVQEVADQARSAIGMLAQTHAAAGLALVTEHRRRGLPVLPVTVVTGPADPEWSTWGKTVGTRVDARWLGDDGSLVRATLVLSDPVELGPEQRSIGWLLPADTMWAGKGLTLDAWQSLSVTATVI